MEEKPVLIGVLGGLGPLATKQFFEMILEETDAAADQEFPDLLIMNRASTPDRTAYLLRRSPDSPADVMAADAKTLENAGCAVLAIPCNTSHAFYDEVTAADSVPVLHLVREVAAEHRLGVLCTEGTRFTDLYGAAARAEGMECSYPSEAAQAKISSLIYDCVKAGKPSREQDLTDAFDELLHLGCDGLVLGCTELPIAYRELGLEERYPMALDSLRILAGRCVELSGKKRRVR